MISIIESNPHIFIERFVDAIKGGYVLENSNRGWVGDGPLKEINLFKCSDEYGCATILEYGETVISDYDTQTFLNKLQGALIQKAVVDYTSLYWDFIGLKSVIVHLQVPEPLTKDELDAMSWEELKVECKRFDISGRDRQLITTKYLKATNQGE